MRVAFRVVGAICSVSVLGRRYSGRRLGRPNLFCCERGLRQCNYRRSPFPDELPDVVFRDAYDAFFSYDYTTDGGLVPYLRDRHHLDDIGMGAVHDKYGLILVVTSSGKERVIAKDLQKEVIVADISVPLGFVESVLSQYVEWGKSRWLPA